MTAPASPLPPVRLLIAGGGTGGHLMPALAIGSAVRQTLGWSVTMVGAARGIEATLLPTRDVPYALLPFEPIYRRQWWRNLKWPWLAITLVRQVGALLDRERPDVVLGTGGYAAGPVVWAAARRGLRTAILEQDAYPGLVTRWLARRVDQVYLGAPEAAAHLAPGTATTVAVTGSPIAPPDPARRPAALARFGLEGNRPVVLITGGSQGSLAINTQVAGWLSRDGAMLQDRLTLLWATGKATHAEFRRWHAPPAVQVFEFLDPIADGYAVADLVVARAGMMTIAELSAWGLASILIPLPTAAADHQTKNAQAMASAGAALLEPQSRLEGDRFADLLTSTIGDAALLARLRTAAKARGKPEALRDIVGRLRGLAGPQPAFSNS